MAPLLLALKQIGWLDSLYPRAAKNWVIHKAFFLAFVMAIYSASVKKRATVGCYFNWWDIGPLKRKKVYPSINLCPSLSLAQSESIYPTSIFVISDLNLIFNSNVSAKYQKI